jgi:hypothetical protein
MLQSIPAQLVGSQIIWLAPEPAIKPAQKVLVVWDDEPAEAQSPKGVNVDDLVGRLTWRGDAVAVQREQRDAW